MTRTKVFLPPIPKEQSELLEWARQVTHVFDELNIRAERAAREESVSTESVQWFGVSLRELYYQSAGACTYLPNFMSDIGSGALPSTVPSLINDSEVMPFMHFINAAYSTGAANSNTIYFNWRIPPNYVAGNDLTFRIGTAVTASNDTNAPDSCSLDLTARRNVPSAGKEGFGHNADHPGTAPGNAWVAGDWNTDLCATGVYDLSAELADAWSFDFTDHDFTITSTDASYPLAAGDWLIFAMVASIDGHAVPTWSLLQLANIRIGCMVT